MAAANSPTKLIVPLAGLGTRFMPYSGAVPKEMAYLVDKPVIEHIVEEARLSGMTEVLFILNNNKEIIPDYFRQQKGDYPGMRFRCIRADATFGDGHSILLAKRFVEKDEPFAVSMGDLISFARVPFLKQLRSAYEKYERPVISVEEVQPIDMKDVASKNGMITVARTLASRAYVANDVVEKPGAARSPSRIRLTGKYILTPDIFDYLERRLRNRTGEVKLADALKDYANERGLLAYACRGEILDTGNKLDFLKAKFLLASAHPEYGKPLRAFIRRRLQP